LHLGDRWNHHGQVNLRGDDPYLGQMQDEMMMGEQK
jgi:hypothetical protein